MSYPHQHMSYPHQLGHIQHSSMVASVRLQNIHGTCSNEPRTQEVSQDPAWGYIMVPHDMASMNYRTAPTPTGFGYNMPEAYQWPSQEVSQNPAWSYSMVPHDMAATNYESSLTPAGFSYDSPEAYQQSISSAPRGTLPMINRRGGIRTPQGFCFPTHHSTSTDFPSPLSAASSPAVSMGSKIWPGGPMLDEDFARMALRTETFGIGIKPRQQCQWELDIVPRKRGPPDADMELDPYGWIFKSGHSDVVNQQGTMNTKKRRRTIGGEETGVGATAQWDESRELPVRRTPERANRKSKLGEGLNTKSLVAPLQGVSHSPVPGPSIIGATMGPDDNASRTWTEGRAGKSESSETKGIEDAHDEEETDKERWRRLMRYEEGRWTCAGCHGMTFSDRPTLQRHCKSKLHAKERDYRRCPYCTLEYLRSSHVNRHIKAKHPEEWETRARQRG